MVGFIRLDENEQQLESQMRASVVEVVRFLYALKLFWLGSSYNLSRIRDGRRPREISAGIHVGRIARVSVSSNHASGTDSKPEILHYDVGYAINLAKRVEGASRRGTSSRVFATGEAASYFETWRRERDEALSRQEAELSAFDAVRMSRLSTGVASYFKGIDPPPDVAELELNWELAENVFKDLGSSSSKLARHFTEGIGEALDVAQAPWLSQDDCVDSGCLEILAQRVPSFANYWLRTDAALLLCASGQRSTSALFQQLSQDCADKARTD
jgi:hypothetical protein